jgi:hypothetical protein
METNNPLPQFRYEVYQHFDKRADTLMELVDALSSNQYAHSVAELSLAPCFRREYSALYKGIAACELTNTDLAQLAAPYIPPPRQRNFRLVAIDVSSHPRLYSRTLTDRSCVYAPTVIKGNKPITLGHQYSTVVSLPEKRVGDAPWVIPLSTTRVASDVDKEMVGAKQIQALLTNPDLPFAEELCLGVYDSSYSKPAFLHAQCQHPHQVTTVRVRSNRVFYRRYVPDPDAPATSGHPRWYGERFALRESETWGAPDETHTLTLPRMAGEPHRAEIQAWHNLLMRGKRKPTPLPMHRYPFTLMRVQLYRADGSTVYRKPLWCLIIGQRRAEITVPAAYHAYRQRFDIEHAYRFCNQRMLLTRYQTPETAYEQMWWRLVHLAYLQLWVAQPLAQRLPRPWERYLPTMQVTAPLSPSLVQRDFARIIRPFGTPAQAPKLRGYAPGRAAGTCRPQRERQTVVVKTKKQAQPAANA